ncbi:MAG TPA: DUF937 domain-containing protein [Gemmatimonadales bacterium]|nr:DUF937 domain-containing protein [Gemmatimonadales bacterium]
MSMLDMLQQRLGNEAAVKQIGAQLGTDTGTTQSAIAAALPMLVGALARNAQDPAQAGALSTALSKKHDGSILDNVSGHLGQRQFSDGEGILGHVLGGRKDSVATGLGQVAGLDAGKATMLLSMLAPLVLGALGKAQRDGGLDAGGLAGMLGGERQRAADAAPGVMGMLGKFLDRDGDGSVMDDIGGMLGKFGK